MAHDIFFSCASCKITIVKEQHKNKAVGEGAARSGAAVIKLASDID
jgi:hypothetical protein